jgi:selenium metabolism protein YedF
MSSPVLSCQGLPCPQPVLKTRQAVRESRPPELIVVVDNEAARDNVVRFLTSQNYAVLGIDQEGDDLRIRAADMDAGHPAPAKEKESRTAKPASGEDIVTLIFITKDVLGSGDDRLGAGLMKNFLATLPEMGTGLWRIILVNSAVRLTIETSPVLETLQKLEQSGVSILVCGTCLEFFNLLEQKQVGETTNMLDVVTSLDHADKVITV